MPPWYTIAKSYVGLREIKGDLHNPTILGWLKYHALNIGKWGKGRDETPWCAVFVSHCLSKAGFKGTDHALAAKYATYGKPSRFKKGAIIVIQRKRTNKKNSTGSNRGGYHVGFLVEHGKTYYKILGGNQSNQVKVSTYMKKGWHLVAVRWPEDRDD